MPNEPTRVAIESPLGGDFARNIRYGRACLRHCLDAGVAPFASHLLYPQVYDDADRGQREAGIRAGLVISATMSERWIFTDLGVSEGMQRGMDDAERLGQRVRTIEIGNWEAAIIEPTAGAQDHDGWHRSEEHDNGTLVKRIEPLVLFAFPYGRGSHGWSVWDQSFRPDSDPSFGRLVASHGPGSARNTMEQAQRLAEAVAKTWIETR